MDGSAIRENEQPADQSSDATTVSQPPFPNVTNDQIEPTTESSELTQLTVDGPCHKIYMTMRDTAARYPSDIDISWPSILETDVREEWLREVADLVWLNATEATVHDFVSTIEQIRNDLRAQKKIRRQ